jgi:hypothetical protein
LRTELKRLVELNILIEQANGSFDTVRKPNALNATDQYCLKQLNLTLLSQVLFPTLLERSPKSLFVDPRIGVKRAWRDIMRYDDKGQRTGWIRYFQGRMFRFDDAGRLLDDKDQPKEVAYRVLDEHLIFDPPVARAGK